MKQVSNAIFAVAWLLLAVTAAAKVVSLQSTARLMNESDPVFGVSIRLVTVLATIFEAGICVISLVTKKMILRGLLLTTIGIEFLIYHVFKFFIAPHGFCPCFGSSWKWMSLTEAQATRIAIGLALFITFAGISILVSNRQVKMVNDHVSYRNKTSTFKQQP